MGNEETITQSSVIEALKVAGHTVYRINSGRMRRRYKVAPTGWPDLIVVLAPDGHLVGLEVKVPGKEKPRASQEQMAAEFASAGASYTIVSSAQGAVDALNELQRTRSAAIVAAEGGAEWTNETLAI